MGIFKAKGQSGFVRLPEGDHILRVKAVDFDPEFFTDSLAAVEVTVENQSGVTHKEKFNVAVEGGMKAFTFLVKTVHNRFDIKEGDDLDPYVATMVGKFFSAKCSWIAAVNRQTNQPILTNTGEPVINVRLDDKKFSTGWEVVAEAVEEVEEDEVEDLTQEIQEASEPENFQF